MRKSRKYDIPVGTVIGDYTCVSEHTSENGKGTKFTMKCNVCGREKDVVGATFLGPRPRGTTHKSCGQFEKTEDKAFYTHWQGMRSRTTNPNTAHYQDYGGRGICSDAFKNFIDFKDTMYESYLQKKEEFGEEPSLERIDVNGDYCPENCTWIPLAKQKSNQRKTVEFDVTFPDGHVEHHRDIKNSQLSII